MIRFMVEWVLAAFVQASGASAYVEPQDPDRPPIASADLKALRENNIFAPHKVVRKERPRDPIVRETKPPPPPPKPVPPVVTGIILDPGTRAYQVIVEDKNSASLRLLKAPLFLKAGDEVLVYKIESVTGSAATVTFGETTKTLRVGESFPDAGLKAPEGADTSSSTEKPAETKTPETPAVEAAPDEERRRKIREELQKKLGKKRRVEDEP